MMIKNCDKYTLTSDFNGLKAGTVFEVAGFDIENGTITMMTENLEFCGMNVTAGVVVDADALKKKFAPYPLQFNVDENNNVKKKREFSKWDTLDFYIEDDVELSGNYEIDVLLYNEFAIDGLIKWRTNGKRTEVKIETEDGEFKGHACCSANDDFDINKGVTIAAYRALKKMIDSYIEEVGK